MNLRQHFGFLTVISIVSIALIIIVFQITSKIDLAGLVAMVADVIQIVIYGVWFFQKEVDLTEVPKQVKEIRTIVVKKSEESRVAGEVVSRLISEGVVRDIDLFSMIRSKEIILAYPYAEGLDGKVWDILKGQPLAKMLGEMGFVRTTANQNLMVIVSESLPKKLRDIDRLNSFIKRNLPEEWRRITDRVKESYPAEKYRKWYKRWRSLEGFKVSYILAKSMAHDFLIDYVNKYSFTPEFRKHIVGRIDRKQLKKIFKQKKREVREVVSRMSIKILLAEIPRDVRQKIIEKEDEIKNTLGVKNITDYRLLELHNVTNLLAKLLHKKEETMISYYSSKIIGESQKCYESLKNWGIELR